jgi:hypothetical protein
MWACYMGYPDIVEILLESPHHNLKISDAVRLFFCLFSFLEPFFILLISISLIYKGGNTAYDKCCGFNGSDPTQRRVLQEMLKVI